MPDRLFVNFFHQGQAMPATQASTTRRTYCKRADPLKLRTRPRVASVAAARCLLLFHAGRLECLRDIFRQLEAKVERSLSVRPIDRGHLLVAAATTRANIFLSSLKAFEATTWGDKEFQDNISVDAKLEKSPQNVRDLFSPGFANRFSG